MNKDCIDAQQLAELYHYSREGIVIFNADGVITFQSDAVTKILGYEKSSLLGQSIFHYFPKKDWFLATKHMALVLQGELLEVTDEVMLLNASGEWLHMEFNYRKSPQGDAVICSFFDITRAKNRHHAQLAKMYQDALTNLPNAVAFKERAQAMMVHKAQRKFAIIRLDINDLKSINDTFGHHIGDELLQKIAQLLTTTVGADVDYIARYGGDDFAILLTEKQKKGRLDALAQLILQLFSKPLAIKDYHIMAQVSLGISIYPESSDDFDQLMLHASRALQIARQENTKAYQIYSPKADVLAYKIFMLRSELQKAVSEQQFELYYQPIVCAQTNTIISAEALIRWIHPLWGIVPPNEFIPALEETGLILPVGEWIIAETCEQIAHWHSMGMNVRVSMNMSAMQLFQDDIVTVIAQALARTGIQPESLVMEITETIAIMQKEVFLQTVEAIRALGVKVSLDDFGAGYSSFSKILDIKPDILKLDRSMICNIETDKTSYEVTKTLIDLAHRLNMKVVAEGIETASQLAVVANIGCDYLQGYYFSKPIAVADFEAFYANGKQQKPIAFICGEDCPYTIISPQDAVVASMKVTHLNGKRLTLGHSLVAIERMCSDRVCFTTKIALPANNKVKLTLTFAFNNKKQRIKGELTHGEEVDGSYRYQLSINV